MSTDIAILIGAALATLGWLYTGRRSRVLARKQHTINVMLQASFHKDIQESFDSVRPFIKDKRCPDLSADENEQTAKAFRTLLNHYEFIAAGLRNGDFDERLVKDSERGSIIGLVEACHDHIYNLRNNRSRQTIYEHVEWLHRRWEKRPPNRLQRVAEYLIARPFQGDRVDPHE